MTTPVTLRPMTEAEFSTWRPHWLATYAAEHTARAGPIRRRRAPRGHTQMEGFLKDGGGTEGHDLLRVVVADEPVGWLWLGPHPDKAGTAWVYEIELEEHARGRGIGRATMLTAEALVASRGVRELGLNVFGHNERAIHLYRSLGYATTSMNMAKSLEALPATRDARSRGHTMRHRRASRSSARPREHAGKTDGSSNSSGCSVSLVARHERRPPNQLEHRESGARARDRRSVCSSRAGSGTWPRMPGCEERVDRSAAREGVHVGEDERAGSLPSAPGGRGQHLRSHVDADDVARGPAARRSAVKARPVPHPRSTTRPVGRPRSSAARPRTPARRPGSARPSRRRARRTPEFVRGGRPPRQPRASGRM